MTENPPLLILGVAILIGIVHILLQASSATKDTGLKWNMGPRDEAAPVGPMAGRLARASENFRETFPFFAVAMIAAYLGGQVDHVVIWAGWTYVIARALYIPLYALGVSGIRSVVWGFSCAAILVIVACLLL